MAHIDGQSDGAAGGETPPPPSAVPPLPQIVPESSRPKRKNTRPRPATSATRSKNSPSQLVAKNASGNAKKPATGRATAAGNKRGNKRRSPQTGQEGTKPSVAVAADESASQTADDLAEVAVRNAPAWLVSLVFHTLLIITLALIYVAQEIPKNIALNVTYAETMGEQLDDETFQSANADMLAMDDPVFSLDELPVDDPLASAPEITPRINGFLPTDTVASPSIGLALSGRQRGMKEALLAKYGGTATTEAAVTRALQWLARNQRRDGTWSLKGPYSQGSPDENKTSATAMALLAFQGAGNTHKAGKYKTHVRRGMAALLKMQDRDGNFFHGSEQGHRLYSQAQATIAVCEIYGMTQDPMFAQPAQLAVDYAVKIQASEGGWRYRPGVDSDTSVTGWFVMGLQSALMAGLEVPSPTLQQISNFLDTVQVHQGSFYKYQPIRKGFQVSMTAEGLLCRQYLGWKQDDARLLEGAEYLLENPIDWEARDVYYWYYATQVLHHLEGPFWEQWNNVMREKLPAQQVLTGTEQGSWQPEGDRWSSHGGRLYTTCMSTFMLEVYYRHLPIYAYQSD